MTTIISRTSKGSPLTNVEIDANFTNLNTDKAERVSGVLVTPNLGTPTSLILTSATGLPVATGISGLASGIASFLTTPSSASLAAALTDETGSGANVFATNPVLVTPNLGTPSSLLGTNITGIAAGLTAGTVTTNANLTGAVTSVGNAASLGSFTSATLATALTDETGTGVAVFSTNPILVTPNLGTPTALVLTSATGLPLTTGVTSTLPVANGGTGITSLGTGVANALGVNTGTVGAFVVNGDVLTVDGIDAVGFRNVPVNSQSVAYTTVLADSGKVLLHPSTDTTARTFTIAANSSVAYPLGTIITFVNMSTATVTIAITTDTLYLSSSGATGSFSLSQYGSAAAIKITTTSWLISGSGLI